MSDPAFEQSAQVRRQPPTAWRRILTSRALRPWLYLAPLLVLLGVLVLYPLGYSIYLMFHRVDFASGTNTFIGIDNFSRILHDDVVRTAATNTITYVAASAAAALILGLAFALVAYHAPAFWRRALLLSFLIPWALPPMVVSLMFFWLFDGSFGLVNVALLRLGIIDFPIGVFSDTRYALWGLALVNVWKLAALAGIILYTALQALPADTLASARLDGAKRVRRLVFIILPYLSATLVATSIVMIYFSFQSFDNVLALTQGGPGYATYTLYFYAYQVTFLNLDFGYGAVVSWLVTLLVFAVGLVLTRRSARALVVA